MTRNIVLFCLDTVRYDYFQQYADDLQSVSDYSFEACRTASTWSVPSHASIFTGSLPNEHGFHSATPSFVNLNREDTFLSELDGFRFVGVSANPYASPIFGFDDLFDEFYHIESSMPYPEGLSPSAFWHESSTEGWRRYPEFLTACLTHDHPTKSIANGAVSQIEKLFQRLPLAKPFDDGCKRILSRTRRVLEDATEPTFAFVNIMDAHGPLANVRAYDQSLIAPEHRNRSLDIDALSMNMDGTFDDHNNDLEAYRDVYAAAVEYTTRKVAAFCEAVGDDTAIIVTSDHGEQLDDVADERRFGHITPDMSEQLLHVPLVVVNADLSVDESASVSHLDLGNLVTSLATGDEFEPAAPIAAEVAGMGVAHPPTNHEAFSYWNRNSRCVYLNDGESKYVWDSLGTARHYERVDEAYVLQEEGSHDLVPSATNQLFQTPIKKVDSGRGSTEIDSLVESQLEELGYI